MSPQKLPSEEGGAVVSMPPATLHSPKTGKFRVITQKEGGEAKLTKTVPPRLTPSPVYLNFPPFPPSAILSVRGGEGETGKKTLDSLREKIATSLSFLHCEVVQVYMNRICRRDSFIFTGTNN